MLENKLVSIIITSYNYGHFLDAAIGSALNQTYSDVEVIVVDDGSTDHSREVIARYGSKLQAVFKENGGQASAFNAGFEKSRGAAVCFLDSDDLLQPGTLASAMALMDASTVKVHWPLSFIDERGRPTGAIMHGDNLSEGDLAGTVIRYGPAGYNWSSTSGNLWNRNFISAVFPMPEEPYRIGPDVYLSTLAPFHGQIRKLSGAGGSYRIHTGNNTFRKPIETRVREALVHWDYSFQLLSGHCGSIGVEYDVEEWISRSWWHQLSLALEEIKALIPEKKKLILVDDFQWVAGKDFMNRNCLGLVERNGENWGPPPDSATAIQLLEEHRRSGVAFIVFAAPAFWWLEEYSDFHDHLRRLYPCRIENRRLIVFDLRMPLIKNNPLMYDEYCS